MRFCLDSLLSTHCDVLDIVSQCIIMTVCHTLQALFQHCAAIGGVYPLPVFCWLSIVLSHSCEAALNYALWINLTCLINDVTAYNGRGTAGDVFFAMAVYRSETANLKRRCFIYLDDVYNYKMTHVIWLFPRYVSLLSPYPYKLFSGVSVMYPTSKYLGVSVTHIPVCGTTLSSYCYPSQRGELCNLNTSNSLAASSPFLSGSTPPLCCGFPPDTYTRVSCAGMPT